MGRILRRFALVCLAFAFAVPAGADISLSTSLPSVPFSSLPTCNGSTGPQIWRVNNASAVGACDGSGSAATECICDPVTSTYRALGGSGGGSSAFSAITGSTNTTAAMVVGSGASLTATGSGSIVATTGDSATAFFTSGQLERARGGLAADTSAFGAGIFGSDGSNVTIDVDTEAELETALGGINLAKVTDNVASATTALSATAAGTAGALAANGANTSAIGKGFRGVDQAGAIEAEFDIARSGTATAAAVTCDFAGQLYVETDTLPSPTVSICTVPGAPGTWQSLAKVATGATIPTGNAACDVAGDLYRQAGGATDLLWLCRTAGTSGTAVWDPITTTRLGTASASAVTCDFLGQRYVETDTLIISTCIFVAAPGTWTALDYHPYAPTTSADWTGFVADTIHQALDYLATRVRYAVTALSYDGFVDLTGGIRWDGVVPTSIAGAELQAVQEMLNPSLAPVSTQQRKSYGVAGIATVTADDFRYRNDGAFDLGYGLGFGVIPATVFSGGGTAGWPLPITGAAGAATRIDEDNAIEIDFVNAVFNVSLAGGHIPANTVSNAPLVLMQIGDEYGAGFNRGTVERGVTLRGDLHIIRTGDQDGSTIQGAIPNLFGSATSFYGLFLSQAKYMHMDAFRINCTGIFNGTTVFDDYDDTCVYSDNSWGNRININSIYTAVGFQAVGNSEAVVVSGRVANGGVGALLGGPQGGDVQIASLCAAGGGSCNDVSDDTDGVVFDNIVVEGNVDGGLVQMDGSRNIVKWGYWEPPGLASNLLGHGICINCGVCAAGSRAAMVCGRDADCPSSTCTEPAGVGSYRSLGSFDWTGHVAGDNFSVPFDSIFIGDGATSQTGRIKISGSVDSSHSILEAPTTVAGLPTCNFLNKDRTFWVTDLMDSGGTTGGGSVQEQLYCTGAAYVNQGVVSSCSVAGSRCYAFGFGPSAKAIVDVTDIYNVGGTLRWPPYPTLYHAMGTWNRWQVDETQITTGNCLDAVPNKTDRGCAEEETHGFTSLATGGRSMQAQRFVWRTASTAPAVSVACAIDLRRMTNTTGFDGGGVTMVNGILIHGSKATSGGVNAINTNYIRYPHDANGKVEPVTEGFGFAVSFKDTGMADECVNDDGLCTCTGTNTLKAVADVYSVPFP